MQVVHPKYLEVVYHFVTRLALRFCYLFGAVVAIELGMIAEPGHASEGERIVGYESDKVFQFHYYLFCGR